MGCRAWVSALGQWPYLTHIQFSRSNGFAGKRTAFGGLEDRQSSAMLHEVSFLFYFFDTWAQINFSNEFCAIYCEMLCNA